MKIQYKISGGVITTVVGLVGILAAVLGSSISAGFGRVEKADTEKNVLRVVDAVEASLKGIQNSLLTWSLWDDAYRYVANPNKAFEESNMGASAFTGMNIHMLVFVKNNGKIIHAAQYDNATGSMTSAPKSLLALLSEGAPLTTHSSLESVHSGLVTLPEGVLMVVAGPVTTTNMDKPYNGTLLFGRWFDRNQQTNLARITHMDLTFTPTQETMTSVQVEPKNRDVISGMTVIKDMQGKPALKVRADIDRAVARQGRTTIRSVVIALAVVGLVLFGVIYFMVNRLVVARILALSTQLSAKNMSFDFSSPTAVPGRNDEIADLTDSVNGLIAAAQQVFISIGDAGK